MNTVTFKQKLYSHMLHSYLCGHFAIVYPAHSCKVCWFCTVESMIEASMVAIREGDHKFSSFLSNLIIENNEDRQVVETWPFIIIKFWNKYAFVFTINHNKYYFILWQKRLLVILLEFSKKFIDAQEKSLTEVEAYLIKGDAVLLQYKRGDQSHLVTEKSLTSLEAIGEEA